MDLVCNVGPLPDVNKSKRRLCVWVVQRNNAITIKALGLRQRNIVYNCALLRIAPVNCCRVGVKGNGILARHEFAANLVLARQFVSFNAQKVVASAANEASPYTFNIGCLAIAIRFVAVNFLLRFLVGGSGVFFALVNLRFLALGIFQRNMPRGSAKRANGGVTQYFPIGKMQVGAQLVCAAVSLANAVRPEIAAEHFKLVYLSLYIVFERVRRILQKFATFLDNFLLFLFGIFLHTYPLILSHWHKCLMLFSSCPKWFFAKVLTLKQALEALKRPNPISRKPPL